MEKHTDRKHHRLGLFLLFWALILLILGTAACLTLYRYLAVYEVTRPETVIEQLLSETQTDTMLECARSNNTLELTEYEDRDQLYSEYLNTVDIRKPLNYRTDQKQSNDDRKVYIVRAGASDICSVVLTPAEGSPGFGRHYWQVSEIQSAPITNGLSSVTLSLMALKDQKIFLNGKPLSSKDITETDISISDLGILESQFNPLPCFVTYTIGPLYGDVKVTDESGNTISPLNHSEFGVLQYQTAYPVHNIRIQAPEDLQIVINGAKLRSSDAASLSAGVLKNLDAYAGDSSIKTATYHFEGLYSIPVVSAYDQSGKEIAPTASSDESYAFFHESDAEDAEELQRIAERFFNAYMDYSAHAYDITLFYNLLNQTLPGTELHNYFSTTRDTMIWAGSSTDERQLQYSNFHTVSPTCFVCTVTYSVDRTSSYWNSQETTIQEGAYEIAFVSSSGRWYAAAMNIISV